MKWILGLGLLATVAGVLTLVAIYFYFSEGLPKIGSLADYQPPVISTVYSDDGQKIGEFFKQCRIVIPLSEMPKELKEAFIAAEDSRFYTHPGIDFFSILRAMFKNIEAGTIVQGGSTITQQVTKTFFLSPKRSYVRKIREAILAYRIDRAFSKDQVLYLYLNQIYLGHGAYGVEAAAENYFGKKASELNLAQCAILAGLPQAPSRYSPFSNPDLARERQTYVLKRMVVDGYVSQKQATEALNTPLDLKPKGDRHIERVPTYTEEVRRYVERKYGANALYNQGLQIYAAVNIDMQKAAREAVQKGLADLDKRQGYRGPLQHLAPGAIDNFCQSLAQNPKNGPLAQGRIVQGVVIGISRKAQRARIRMGAGQGFLDSQDMRWASAGRRIGKVLKVGDVILVRLKEKEKSGMWALSLEQVPKVQAALLCIASGTGQVKAMIGGNGYSDIHFNRALQSRRQPGSAFKPVIYAAAIDKGYTPVSVIIDSPIIFAGAQGEKAWKPKNYEDKFLGPTLLRDALAYSRNVVTIKILQNIGIDYVVGYARKLGITSTLKRNLSLALGSSGLSLMELTEAYSVFNNLGERIKPVFITKIVDRNGNVLEQSEPNPERVISKSTAYIMTSLLQSVVEEGTGRRVLSLKRPAAGKTGTTNDFRDAWFIGYTPEFTTGVWVGFDNEKSLGWGETGARAASPIWLDFMQRALTGKPVQVFQIPKGVVFAKVDADTGLLPNPETKHTIFECFKEGTVPTQHSPKPNSVVGTDQFFKSNM